MMDLEKAARNARAVAESRFELGIEGRPTAISEFLVEYQSFHAVDNVEGNNESATIERLERKLVEWCSDLGGRTIVWRQLPTFREIIDRSERSVSVTIHLRARAHCLGDVPAGYIQGVVRKSQWRPIEIAPKNGTPVLAYGPGLDDDEATTFKRDHAMPRHMAVVFWSEHQVDDYEDAGNGWLNPTGGKTVMGGWASGLSRFNPTHWMPLPEPPHDIP